MILSILGIPYLINQISYFLSLFLFMTVINIVIINILSAFTNNNLTWNRLTSFQTYFLFMHYLLKNKHKNNTNAVTQKYNQDWLGFLRVSRP